MHVIAILPNHHVHYSAVATLSINNNNNNNNNKRPLIMTKGSG